MDYKTVLTTCTYCGCGCGFYLEVLDGQVIDTIPCKTNPVSQGKLCIKGWNVHEFIQSPKRLTKPLVRKDGELVEVSWDEALDYTVSKLKSIKASHGGDAIAFCPPPRSPTRRITCSRNSPVPRWEPTAWTTARASDTLPLWQVLPQRSEVAP